MKKCSCSVNKKLKEIHYGLRGKKVLVFKREKRTGY